MFGITVLVYYKGKYFKSLICYIVKGNYLILWDILSVMYSSKIVLCGVILKDRY